MLDLYVRDAIYTVNEARGILGFDPVAGGDQAMVYGNAGPVPLTPAPSPARPAARLGRTARIGGLNRLARADALLKYDPDQPRVPAGNPDGSEWTTGGGGSAEDVGPNGKGHNVGDSRDAGGAANARNAQDTNANALPIAYPGDYHDAVVHQLKDYLTANGGKVITGVTLNAIDGTSAVADMMVKLPPVAPFILEVKTGLGAQFTDPQRIVYPMAQVGGHVSSPNGALNDIGLTPGELLPPLKVYIYWVVNPGERAK